MRHLLACALTLGVFTTMAFAADKSDEHDCSLDFKVKNIDGETVDLEDYEGKVVLIVNVASKCGLTKQYTGLEALYKKYEDKGFVILGFPCNQFKGQEPGSEADIKKFCSTKYNVTFPLFSKVEVNGEGACDLYKHLTSTPASPVGEGEISWNFEKFLINRDGKLVHRFSPRTVPEDEELVKAIEAELN